MRCPKCGYISFDHVESCLKCGKNISKVSSKLEGTTYNVTPPSFLKFDSNASTQAEEKTEISFDAGQDDFDVVDPDLDVLVDDQGDEAGISFGDELEGLGGLEQEESFELGTDDDGIDLGQFEDAFDEQEAAPMDDDIALDLPDELADISDLDAPQSEPESQIEPEAALAADEPGPMPEELPGLSSDKDEIGDFSLNLDLDELGDDFSLTEEKAVADETTDPGLDDLSLDDLGLSDDEEEKAPPPEVEADSMDMDADLDFDLDLGGISLDEEK